MLEPVKFNITAGAWAEVASGAASVTVSTSDNTVFTVCYGDEVPTLATPGLDGRKDFPVQLYNLPTGTKVYARSVGLGSGSVTVARH